MPQSWTGEVCSGSGNWSGIACQGGRVTGVELNGAGASGALDGFDRLTALTSLKLNGNNFPGELKGRSPAW